MDHEVEDVAANPSEKMVEQQRSSVPSILSEFADEEPLISSAAGPSGSGICLPSPTFLMNPAGVAAGSNSKPAKGSGKPRGGSSKAGGPLVEAYRSKAKTAREYKAVESALNKARDVGTCVLETDAVKVHGSIEAADADVSLTLLRCRMELLQLAMNDEMGKSSITVRSKQFYNSCLKDPYLKDLQTSILSSEDGCRTLAAVRYTRNTLLDLQPSVEKVQHLMDSHKNALQLLKTVAQCVQKESETWRSTAQALIKAKKDEQQAQFRVDKYNCSRRHTCRHTTRCAKHGVNNAHITSAFGLDSGFWAWINLSKLGQCHTYD